MQCTVRSEEVLFRFCLYGFLKNQQYYDPFIILAFREKGLSFALIGLLIGFREICINVLEVPAGAVADVVGRRRSMIFSFLAYVVAFLVFGLSSHLRMLFAAMFFFSIGEAFRTGTHKAIIFDWLAREDRSAEKTRVYGHTRSWSKLGSAVSVVIAAALIFKLQKYSYVFLFCIVPYAANIINFLSYPSYLDGPRKETASVLGVMRTSWVALRDSVRNPLLFRCLAESMSFEGCYRVCKDYLQPVLKATALALPLLLGMAERQRTAVVGGAVYLLLYLSGSLAARRAGDLVKGAGSEQRGSGWLWAMNAVSFGILSLSILMKLHAVAISAFVALAILQNLWRPIIVSRVASLADHGKMATVLSIESQAKTLFAAIVAPLLGLTVDLMAEVPATLAQRANIDPARLSEWRFLPVGLLGLAVALIMLAAGRSQRRVDANR